MRSRRKPNRSLSVPESERTDPGRAALPEGDDAGAEFLAQVSRMCELAHGGEWRRIESLADRIDAMVDGMFPDRDGEALMAARAGIQRVISLATTARNEVGDKLTTIRQGRKATASYRETGTLRARL